MKRMDWTKTTIPMDATGVNETSVVKSNLFGNIDNTQKNIAQNHCGNKIGCAPLQTISVVLGNLLISLILLIFVLEIKCRGQRDKTATTCQHQRVFWVAKSALVQCSPTSTIEACVKMRIAPTYAALRALTPSFCS